MPKANPLKREPSTNASQAFFLVLAGGRAFITRATCSSIPVLLLRPFSCPRGVRPFCPLLDPFEHPPLHDEVLSLHKQIVEDHFPHTRLVAASLPQEQARGAFVDLFQDEGPSASSLRF